MGKKFSLLATKNKIYLAEPNLQKCIKHFVIFNKYFRELMQIYKFKTI